MAPVLRHCPCLRPENDDVRLLDYSHSNLEDVPNEVFGFERTLEELFLDANQIKDLPRPLFHCHGLKKLNLSDNEIQTLPPAIASLINLEQLDISKNGVLEIPDNIKGCKCLTVIDASVNPLGKLPEGFTYLINLQELYLNDTFLEYLPANFGRLSRLKILELRENHLKLLPKSMARLTELSRLDIGQNDFSDLPEVIGNLPRLVELWCDNNNLNCLPPFLGGLKKLAYLDASKNKIYEVADEIEGCINLCDLTLSSNRIKVLPDGIANLKKLSVLRVDENRLISVPENIGNIANLEELVLSSNNLKTLPASLGLLRNLRTLIADDNLLEELPYEMGSCMKLTILSLRDNKLVQVPDELGHITALKVINLSGNLLQYLPFSIAKLPNLQALWLSENQNKPLIPLQSDTDKATGQKVLTCFMLPQVPLEEEVYESGSFEVDVPDPGKGKHIIKFAFDAEKDQPSKLVRAPTPYPKELKAHARHARNYALKKQGSKDSEGNETTAQNPSHEKSNGLNAIGATPDIMILPTGPSEEPKAQVKEAVVSNPKSPLSSPPKHERHYIQNTKDQSSQEMMEMKPHAFLEQNPLQVSHHQSNEAHNPEVPPKVLGRRDSRGDGSSSENTSTSAAGSPKSTPDGGLSDGYSHISKTDKDAHFKKNIPPSAGKRDTWMRQRLLRQGSGDSDRGYRSDHEVYLAERDQYGQGYHDGYASDWEAFLAKQNYNNPSNAELQGNQQYMRPTLPHGELSYRGHAEGQEIKADGEVDGYSYPWDSRFQYPDESNPVLVDDEYSTRISAPSEGYWQIDPASGQFYPTYDMSHSYPPAADNAAYLYARNQRSEVLPTQSQYYEDSDGYKRTAPHFWTQRMPNPGSVACNNTVTLPRRLATPSPRLKRSQCLSVQAPLHGSPQEYHLIPHQTGNLHPPIPTGSPRPGRSPSPGIDRVTVQYSPQPYPKFAPHFQTPPYSQGYPITTQPMNTVHFPPPMPNVHNQYQGNFPPPSQMYPAMPPSPRMKQTAHQFMMSTVDDSALISRPYPMLPPPVVHGSNYYPPSGQGNLMPGTSLDPYSQALQSTVNQDVFSKSQETEYGVMPSSSLQYRSGSIPAHIQNIENCDVNDIQQLNRSVPSINIIPSTSPPTSAYLTSSENWRGDPNKVATNNAKMELPSSPKLKHPEDHTLNHTVPPESNKNLISSEEKSGNEIEKETANATSSSTSSLQHKTGEDTPITVHNSYTVIAPKASKIIPEQITTESCNSVSNNKDVILSHNTNERPSVFRKPGCFQAVPVNIPSVHGALHRKESIESEAKQMHSKEDLKSKCSVVKDSKAENSELNEPKLVSNSSDIHCQDTLTSMNSSTMQETSPGFESKKQAGFVGGIVNYINKSLNIENKTPEVKQKSALQNVQQIRPSSAPPEIVKKDNNRSEFSSKVVTKPGYPVQVKSDQNEKSVTAENKDQPPELPKKEKSLISMRNVALIPERSNSNSYEPSIKNYYEENRKLPPEKICQPSNSNKSLQHHSSVLSDHSKANQIQNEIARENSKNMKITNYSLANKLSKQKELNTEKYTPEESKCSVENNKLRSSDKRFQKVLPPIDKNFQLKPCNARKNFSQGELNSKDNDNEICTEQRNSEQEENNEMLSVVETPPSSIPPKTHSLCIDHSHIEKNVSHIPPSLPPKRSSTLVPTTSDLTLQNSKENSLSNDILHKALEDTSKAKLVSENTVTFIENDLKQNSMLQIDIVKMKDANNEKNEQLQKENMPDLISRIIPNEKKELILAENQDKIIDKEEFELAKDNNPHWEQTESIKYKNPESPKRQSWFFGTHKNSLVFPVIILKNPELGFSIEGGIGSPRNPGKPSDNGIYVAHVLENGPASNLLRPGDKILQVDGNDFTQLDHNKAIAVLQESGTTVSLMVSRE